MKQLFYPLFFISASFLLIHCRKHDATPVAPPLQVSASDSITGQPVIATYPSYPVQPSRNVFNYSFNWETTNVMPGPSGAAPIYVPWSDHAVRAYNPELRYDYKAADGWELVFNTYSPTPLDNRLFVLYNKFRGIIRFYCYLGTNNISQVADYNVWMPSMKLGGVPSNLLNFADQHIVDVTHNSSTASEMDPWPITFKGWYISQFEMAYDPELYQRVFTEQSLAWVLQFGKLLNASANGNAISTYSLNLQQQGVDLANHWFNASLSGTMQALVRTPGEFAALKGVFPDGVISTVQQQVNGNARGNVFNALLIPKNGITNVKLETNFAFQRLPNGALITSPNFGIPGQNFSTTVGGGPLFNEPPGIFYLVQKPSVNYTQPGGQHVYQLDVASVVYIFNPFIANYASIANIKQELVAEDAEEKNTLSAAIVYSGQQLKANKPLKIIGVRTSFDVVPKNGSDTVHIVKTFAANVNGE